MPRSRTAFRSLAPTWVAVLASVVFAGTALAGGPPQIALSVAGCQDPTEAGADAFDVLDINPGFESCPRACKDGAKACLGASKTNLSCIVKVAKPLIKAIARNCLDDPETADECLDDLDFEAGQLGDDLKTEKGRVKAACLNIFGGCLEACFGPS